mmetsp:Transcript_105775/g.183859  ORF Transcript_105775/g.183859 Transcript_105775/m.183859 type:complete len:321 (+) Transcript_105775:68-1030(+)
MEEERHWMYDGSGGACPGRDETMYLNVVRPRDVPRGPTRVWKDDTQALRTHDIEGCAPTYKHHRFFVDGPPEKEPIELNAPKAHYPDLRRVVDLPLTTADIERAQPNAHTFKTRRVVNPLLPKYDLPSSKERPVTPPKQRVHENTPRETMEFKGDWKPRILERDYSRNPAEPKEGTEYSWQKRKAMATRDPLRTVEKAGERILSSRYNATPRETNPMDPVYGVCTRTTHPLLQSDVNTEYAPREAGQVSGATSRRLHYDNGEPQASLIRSDLPGATSQRFKGHLPISIYDPPEVTPYSRHDGLTNSDILGAQSGTRIAGR